MSRPIRALTLRHPWAWCIAHLGKNVENRDWSDSLAQQQGLFGEIGRQIVIHGGSPVRRGDNQPWREHVLAVDHIGEHILPEDSAAFDRLKDWNRRMGRRPTYDDLVLPGIVAVATLVQVGRGSGSAWAVDGQLHLVLGDIHTLPQPVPCKGAQGLWDVPEAVLAEMRAVSRRAAS